MKSFLFIAIAALLVGCGKGSDTVRMTSFRNQGGTGPICTMVLAFGLSINVLLPAGVSSSGLNVTVQEGSYSESAVQWLPSEDGRTYSFAAAGERAGTYSITASLPGHAPITQSGIVVTKDECHVKPVTVSLTIN